MNHIKKGSILLLIVFIIFSFIYFSANFREPSPPDIIISVNNMQEEYLPIKQIVSWNKPDGGDGSFWDNSAANYNIIETSSSENELSVSFSDNPPSNVLVKKYIVHDISKVLGEDSTRKSATDVSSIYENGKLKFIAAFEHDEIELLILDCSWDGLQTPNRVIYALLIRLSE